MTKLHIKKGDTVFVISGEDKGKQGKVSLVTPDQLYCDSAGTLAEHGKKIEKELGESL